MLTSNNFSGPYWIFQIPGAICGNFSEVSGAPLASFVPGLFLQKVLNPDGYDSVELVLFWPPKRQIRSVKYPIPKYEASGTLEQRAGDSKAPRRHKDLPGALDIGTF